MSKRRILQLLANPEACPDCVKLEHRFPYAFASLPTNLQGDRVFGCLDTFFPYVREGCYAQYVAAKESQLAKLPEGPDFQEAAGVPLVALTAWQVWRCCWVATAYN